MRRNGVTKNELFGVLAMWSLWLTFTLSLVEVAKLLIWCA
jgi:hypothetical protein